MIRLRSLALLTLPLLSTCGAAPEGPQIWRFALEEPVGSLQYDAASEFERLIEERTDGRVDVQLYPLGTLGTSDDITEQLRMGSLQFAMASPGHLGKTIPAVQAFLLHFTLSEDRDVNRRALSDPEVLSVLRPLYAERDLELLAVLPEGWMTWSSNKPLTTPEHFSGVKIRTMTSPLLLDTYEAYGADPTALPYGEVYGALQLGMIDAQVNPLFAIEEMSFYEVQSHLTRPRTAPFVTTLAASSKFLARLPAPDAALVRTTVQDVARYLHDREETVNEERLAKMLAKKPDLEVTTLTDTSREAFHARVQPVIDQFRQDTAPEGPALLDALQLAVARAEDAEAAAPAGR